MFTWECFVFLKEMARFASLWVILLEGIYEHAASGQNIFATRLADGGGYTMLIEVISKRLHLLLVGAGERLIDSRMEADKVHSAMGRERGEQPY